MRSCVLNVRVERGEDTATARMRDMRGTSFDSCVGLEGLPRVPLSSPPSGLASCIFGGHQIDNHSFGIDHSSSEVHLNKRKYKHTQECRRRSDVLINS